MSCTVIKEGAKSDTGKRTLIGYTVGLKVGIGRRNLSCLEGVETAMSFRYASLPFVYCIVFLLFGNQLACLFFSCPFGYTIGRQELFGDFSRQSLVHFFLLRKAACELLYILKEDFDEVLKPTLTAHLKDVRTALARFEYFRGWSQSQVGK